MTPSSKLYLGLTLTASAGFVDAVAFLQLGGFYASFMSGNTTQLGVGIAGQARVSDGNLIWFPIMLISLFFIGAFLGTLTVQAYERRGTFFVKMSVVMLLVLVSLLGKEGTPMVQPVLLLAAAMGAQNAAVKPIGAVRLGVTYVTGTLFNAAADLAGALRGSAPKWRWLQHFSVWVSLMTGAATGALCLHYIGIDAVLVPAAVISVTSIIYGCMK